MLRRKLTPIEMKVSDLEEFEAVKKEREAAKSSGAVLSPEVCATKSRMESIHTRIGYQPPRGSFNALPGPTPAKINRPM